jgi:hypothetical protein
MINNIIIINVNKCFISHPHFQDSDKGDNQWRLPLAVNPMQSSFKAYGFKYIYIYIYGGLRLYKPRF